MNAFSQPSPSQRTANDEEGADAPIAFAPASIMPKPSWWKRVTFALAVLGAAGELVARYGVGLGDPPLSQADPQIEYLFKPNQDCRRLGRRVAYNQYSMRSDPFPVHKADPNEIRVMVVGDSVVNGGVLTDQSELATEVLKRKLAAKLNRPVVIGNISAGSWGPPNELAYLKRFGLFDADVLVLVLSSHDYIDVPTFVPVVGVDPAFPGHKPISALGDGFARYLMPLLRKASHEGLIATPSPAKREDIDACLSALREMIGMGRARGAKVIVALHLSRDERMASPQEGHDYFVRQAKEAGVTPVELGISFESARQRAANPYLDHIHPNALGHALIADALLLRITSDLRD